MKVLSLVLIALIALIQYPLWLGKGSWFRVWEVDQQIKSQPPKQPASEQSGSSTVIPLHPRGKHLH